jgi:hypothetical protein
VFTNADCRRVFTRGLVAITCVTSLAGAPRALAASAAEARALTVITLDGHSAPFGKILRAQRPSAAVVLFWSLYQPESRRALKALDRHARQLGETGFSVLTVALPEYKESPSAVSEFLARAAVRSNTVMDPTGALLEAYSRADRAKTVLPLAVVLTADGDVKGIVTGWSARWVDSVDEIVSRSEKAKP